MTGLPGLYSTYVAPDSDVTVYARFAAFDERTTPTKVYVFNAKSYTVEETRVTPLNTQYAETGPKNHVAEYIGPTTTQEVTGTQVVFYHLDEFHGLAKQERVPETEYEAARASGELPPLPSFTRYYILAELHELCHWAITEEHQPETDSHSPVWNAILLDAIEYATETEMPEPDFNYEFTDQSDESVTVPDLTMDPPHPQHQMTQQPLPGTQSAQDTSSDS